jgi:hypothetical protein
MHAPIAELRWLYAVRMIATSMLRVHQHAATIADGARQAQGRSRNGLMTKLHAVVDAAQGARAKNDVVIADLGPGL